METRNVGLRLDPLFVAATRPPMRLGVTYVAILANAILTMELFVLTRNLLILLLAAPAHGLCMLLCARDPRYFDLLSLAMRTRLVAWLCSRRFWKGSTYSQLVLDVPKSRGRRRSAVAVYPS